MPTMCQRGYGKNIKLEYEEPKKNFGFDRIGNEVPLNLIM